MADESVDAPIPLAYLITFTCYGTHLHSDGTGSVDRDHNLPGTPYLPPNNRRLAAELERMSQPPYHMDEYRRMLVLDAIREVCANRGWSLLAAHVRRQHVHVTVHAMDRPERVMNDFKAYASRRLNNAGLDTRKRRRWTHHGSTRYLWKPEHVEAAIHYVVHEQGEPMAVYENHEREITI
jgi:REP element-mobilizing transposase RayT